MVAKRKPLPKLSSDADAEAFVASADLTEYDLSSLVLTRVPFKAATARIKRFPIRNP